MTRRILLWLTAARVFGFTAIITGAGMVTRPERYDNPAYRVLFSHATARQTGVAWIIVGVLCAAIIADWTSVLIGSALLGWGTGLGFAALTDPPSGSPLGWLWFVAFGGAILRNVVVMGPDRMRT